WTYNLFGGKKKMDHTIKVDEKITKEIQPIEFTHKNIRIQDDEKIKKKRQPMEFTDKNIRVQNKFSTIDIPIPKKPGEIDLKIKTNVKAPVRKSLTFLSVDNITFTFLCFIILVGFMGYQMYNQADLRLEVIDLSIQLNKLTNKYEHLTKLVSILEDKLESAMSEHNRTVRDVSLFDEKVQDSEKLDNLLANEEEGTKNSTEANSESLYLSKVNSTENNSVSQWKTSLEILLNNSSGHSDWRISTVEQDLTLDRVKRSKMRGNRKKPETRGDGTQTKKSKNHGARALHLKGAKPEQTVRDSGSLIAPWYADKEATGDFPLIKYELRQGNGTVEITEPGLYYIYAQVFYMTGELFNSFIISVSNGNKQTKPRDLAVCSVNGYTNKTKSEITCFTSVVHFLNTNDRVFLRQRERERKILFEEGYSFLGIVQLNSRNGKKVSV
ncbi:hypothetical protein L9F63_001286, partial [Diploptera punctata]